MTKYKVYAIYTASKFIGEIEAENEDDARDKAADTGDDNVSLCHQCAGELDLGDCYEYQVDAVETE